MVQQIKMPSAGQTTDAARITSVLVKVGDKVKRGDTLVEAETDKAVLPVESYLAGTVLEILVKEGDDVTSGDVLMMIGSGAAAPRPAAPTAAKALWPAMPNAKMLARELGVGQEDITKCGGNSRLIVGVNKDQIGEV